MACWFVYYLHDAANDDLLYIGRSDKPLKRKSAFDRRTGLQTRMGTPQRHLTLESASQAEIVAIKKHRPRFNLNVVSSSGFAGHATTDAAKAKQAAYHRGKVKGPLSASTKAKLSAVRKGRYVSEETRRKLSEAARRQWANAL